MKLTIESNIPPPHGRRCYFVLDEIEPGESVLFPFSVYSKNGVYSAVNYRKRKGIDLRTQVQDEGVRVWRI